jgi:hypothetical protein
MVGVAAEVQAESRALPMSSKLSIKFSFFIKQVS